VSRYLLYIVNPISGRENKDSIRERIEKATKGAGLPYSVRPSVADGDYSFLHPLIKEKGVTDIVIAGGDGTVNAVVQSLKNFKLPFGILPCGSGNGLAFSAGIPKDLTRALAIVFAGNSQLTDAFLINGRFACMLCGVGFDAQVAHNFANDPRRGLMTYLRKTVSHFFSAKAYPFIIRTAEEEIQASAFFISIANSNQFGNHFTIAPKARLTDGLLDIVVVTEQNKINLLWHTFQQVRGANPLLVNNIGGSRAGVLYFQTKTLSIENPSKAPLHIDGDPAETTEKIEVSILEDCFALICP
jgi:diacylglycerol kinase (ATP)